MSCHQSVHPSLFSSISPSPSFHPRPSLLFPSPSGAWWHGRKDKSVNFDIGARCSAVSKTSRTQEYADLFQQNGLPLIKWHEIVEDDLEEEALKVSISNEIHKRVKSIKSMLSSMEDGEISISAYDTAWVALVEDVEGSGNPQFPASLEWIAKHQLPGGSWGDDAIFQAHDRLLNTLACVVALKSWNLHPHQCELGMAFFNENLCKLEEENPEHMPIGFEVAFPSLLELARRLDIDVPHDSPVLQQIYASRDLKLKKIPKNIMHNVPTTLLHSLEGMPGLEWDKLLKLQSQDGSFLFSPSSTAYALMQTKDHNCLAYLNNAIRKFNGGVPNVYPIDLFEHIWAVDRLQRLGISRYFEPEIKECVDHVQRHWTKKGICWARNSEVQDIDDTAMAFRLLRLHGVDVSPDVFKHFQKEGEFFCFAGQSNQAVTGMFNLYRASQVLFPGEKILEDAREFSSQFLREKQDANEILDKWIITKDLPGEVKFALDVPWYANLPRVETRFYIEQYGGEDDVWIGKTLYRMPYVNNNEYLQLAKIDYNNCQALHRMEWENFQKWYDECNLKEFGISRRSLLFAYFVAAASIYEPERSKERISWAKTTVLLDAIQSHFTPPPAHEEAASIEQQRKAFVQDFHNGITAREALNIASRRRLNTRKKRQEVLIETLVGTLNHFTVDAAMTHGRDIGHSLRHAWGKWMKKWEVEGERREGEAELLVETINLTAAGGGGFSEEILGQHPHYHRLSLLTNRICSQLSHYHSMNSHHLPVQGNKYENKKSRTITTGQIEGDMQELTQLVLQNSAGGINSDVKRTFFAVARSFYYAAFCDPGTINHHISKVLFQRLY